MKRFSSRVIHGDKHGGSIGYPTANLEQNESVRSALSKFGIYAVLVSYNGSEHPGALFWGHRTLFRDEEPSCEVLLLDFDGDIYSKEIHVTIVEYMRDVAVVDNEAKLADLIAQDIVRVRGLFSKKAL